MGHILKANRARLAGSFELHIDQAAGPKHHDPSGPATPRIRMLENQPEFAVIEITCPCGRITQVRCEYAPAAVTPALEASVNQ